MEKCFCRPETERGGLDSGKTAFRLLCRFAFLPNIIGKNFAFLIRRVVRKYILLDQGVLY
ncbi:MAG: hypothetical protein COX19_17210 [Desulfobacterales bacterium CG23_combo_of_CG06-09_8_20_14_all_51_8]|nr:MAG: hypothetical protein COX19_17210 [Desulfobacterales bacterium CG23_combo_of_CG06-09_8_20_14_all_51_8]